MSLNAEWEKCWIICEGAVATKPSQLQEDNKKLGQLITEQDALIAQVKEDKAKKDKKENKQ